MRLLEPNKTSYHKRKNIMREKDDNRSNQYQFCLLEQPVSPFTINDLSIAQGMNYRMMPFDYNENLINLREKLKKRMWEIIDLGLTERQKEVIKLWAQGKTQNEIAKLLGINQTSVHKVIKGNIDYATSCKKRYGGAFKKIAKLCANDEEIQNILTEIREISECLEI